MSKYKSCKLSILVIQPVIHKMLGIKPKTLQFCDNCAHLKDLKNDLKNTKREMKENGFRVTSCMNRQTSQQAAYYNTKIFRLKYEIERLSK